MTRIDSPGVYKAKVTEHALGTTKVRNDEQGRYVGGGYPQVTAKFDVTQKYVQDKTELAHFKSAGVLTSDEPAWVDYSGYGLDIIGFFYLFNSAEEFSKNTKIPGCDQIIAAFGWTGESFNDLNDDKYVGREVLLRVEEREYNGSTKLEVVWLDDKDASPVRELRKVDESTLGSLNAKLNLSRTAPPKPAVAPAPVPAVAAAPRPTPAPTPNPTPASSEDPPASPAANEMTKDEAWAFVYANKGDNDDGAVTDAWTASCAEIADEVGSVDESRFTNQHWYKIAHNTKKDLGR